MKKRVSLLTVMIFVLALSLGLFLVWQKKKNFEIKYDRITENQEQEEVSSSTASDFKSPLSGLPCANAQRRPIAVMLSGDMAARPLSSINQADLVFEMPVTEGSITRLMAVFVCADPKEIGSVRSARHDFIPLALGVDAIYAHWGGSHFALDKLKAGILDNLDALPNPYNTFYRKSGIEMPHNGFTSIKRILAAAKQLNYRLDSKFVGYPHVAESPPASQEKKTLGINYPGQFKVDYQYNPETNSYLRLRGGIKEIDKNTNQQVEAKNVVVMRAETRPLEGQYNDVQVEGEGKAEFYINGQATKGTWKKDKSDQKSKLTFLDGKKQEIKFVPGQIWIEIADPSQEVKWE